MMKNLKDLQDKRLELANKIKDSATAEDAKNQKEPGTDWSAEDRKSRLAMIDDYTQLHGPLTRLWHSLRV